MISPSTPSGTHVVAIKSLTNVFGVSITKGRVYTTGAVVPVWFALSGYGVQLNELPPYALVDLAALEPAVLPESLACIPALVRREFEAAQ